MKKKNVIKNRIINAMKKNPFCNLSGMAYYDYAKPEKSLADLIEITEIPEEELIEQILNSVSKDVWKANIKSQIKYLHQNAKKNIQYVKGMVKTKEQNKKRELELNLLKEGLTEHQKKMLNKYCGARI